MELTAKRLSILAWGVSGSVAAMALIAWGQGLRWYFSNLSTYRLFPIFGLLAFSLMWSMYMVGFIRRRYAISAEKLKLYYKTLPLLIFLFIMLHPGLLIWQLWRDGFGLPPQSYLQHYVAPSLRWAVFISSTAWLVFIAYEFRYRYHNRSWWKYFEYAADLALVGIFFHALALGTQLRHGWFRYVWFFYGAVLIAILTDLYVSRIKSHRQKTSS